MQFIHFAPSRAAERSFLLIFEAPGAQIRRMVVTMGAQGAVFATLDGEEGGKTTEVELSVAHEAYEIAVPKRVSTPLNVLPE